MGKVDHKPECVIESTTSGWQSLIQQATKIATRQFRAKETDKSDSHKKNIWIKWWINKPVWVVPNESKMRCFVKFQIPL